jgi:hypothetical protein
MRLTLVNAAIAIAVEGCEEPLHNFIVDVTFARRKAATEQGRTTT